MSQQAIVNIKILLVFIEDGKSQIQTMMIEASFYLILRLYFLLKIENFRSPNSDNHLDIFVQ